jgi:membrane protein DedA with SNARE-associated domain
MPFWPVWVAGAMGAALGDWISYWIGYKFKERIAHVRPLSKHPGLLPRGHAFIEKWGLTIADATQLLATIQQQWLEQQVAERCFVFYSSQKVM